VAINGQVQSSGSEESEADSEQGLGVWWPVWSRLLVEAVPTGQRLPGVRGTVGASPRGTGRAWMGTGRVRCPAGVARGVAARQAQPAGGAACGTGAEATAGSRSTYYLSIYLLEKEEVLLPSVCSSFMWVPRGQD